MRVAPGLLEDLAEALGARISYFFAELSQNGDG